MPLNCFCPSILSAMLGREVAIWTDTIIPKNEKVVDRKKKLRLTVDLLHETISSSEEEKEERNIENININEIYDEEWSGFDDEI